MSIRMGDKILAANYKPNNATQDVAGLVRLATEEEITEGIATESVVTPYQLKETVNNKANIDLNNLSETGEARFNGKANVNLDNLSAVGEVKFTEKRNNLTQTDISLSSGTISLNTSSDYYSITPTSNTTFTFSNVPSGVCTFELRIKLSTVYTLTFPSSVKWMNDTPPDMSETGIYFLVFRTEDNGTTWYANCQGKWSI